MQLFSPITTQCFIKVHITTHCWPASFCNSKWETNLDVIIARGRNSLLADTQNFLPSALAMQYSGWDGRRERSESNQLAFIQGDGGPCQRHQQLISCRHWLMLLLAFKSITVTKECLPFTQWMDKLELIYGF